jgi:conjugal transfer pilus assembly protein TraL
VDNDVVTGYFGRAVAVAAVGLGAIISIARVNPVPILSGRWLCDLPAIHADDHHRHSHGHGLSWHMNHGGDETGYIPKALDAQERFLWWEMDQAVIAIMLISMGVIAGSMLTGMVMGAAAAWQYGRMKAGKHPKFAAHALYWWFPSGLFLKLRATPPSDQRYFLG